MKQLDIVAAALVVIGALNWGLVAVARFDLVAALFGMPPVRQFDLAEIELFSSPRVQQWEDKASFATFMEPSGAGTPPVRADQAISRANVVDLTSKMGKDGRLDWDAPAGTWVVLRMGYSLTGTKNHPATPEATG